MGTSIACYISRHAMIHHKTVVDQLADFFAKNEATLKAIRDAGKFSGSNGGWYIVKRSEGHWFGEGPDGFFIEIYPALVKFASQEPFASLTSSDCSHRTQLRQLFAAAAGNLSSVDEIAVVDAGAADAGIASEVALAGGSFNDVCFALDSKLGAPAKSWSELETGRYWWLHCRVED